MAKVSYIPHRRWVPLGSTYHAIDILLLSLVAILPLSVAIEVDLVPSYLISSKAHYFILVTEVIFLIYFLRSFLANSSCRIDAIDLCLIGYAVSVWVQLYIQGHFFNEEALAVLCSVFVACILKQYLSESGEGLRYVLFFVVILTGLWEGLYGELQLLGVLASNNMLFRTSGSFHNPGPFGIYLSVILATLFALRSIHIGLKRAESQLVGNIMNFLTRATIIVLAIVIPFTDSRSAWVGILISALTYVVFHFLFNRRKEAVGALSGRSMVIAVLIGVIILVTLLFWIFKYKEPSSWGRIRVWKMLGETIVEHPWLGIGMGEIRAYFGFLQEDYLRSAGQQTEKILHVSYAYNDYMQILVEGGILRLVLILFVIGLAIRQVVKQNGDISPFSLASAMGMVTLLAAAFFSYPLEMISMWYLFVFFLAIIASDSKPRILFTLRGWKAAILFLSLGIFVGCTESRILNGKILWRQAQGLSRAGRFDLASDAYREVYLLLNKDKLVLPEFGKALLLNQQFSESSQILQRAAKELNDPIVLCNYGESLQGLKKYGDAEKVYRHAIEIAPHRMYPKYLLAKMLAARGDKFEAVNVAKEVLAMRLKTPSLATEQMISEMHELIARGGEIM